MPTNLIESLLKAIFSTQPHSERGGVESNAIRLHDALALSIGDVLEAEFVRDDGDLQLIKIAGKILKAKGLPQLGAGERFFLRVESLGPPPKLSLLAQFSATDESSKVSELLKAKVEFLSIREQDSVWEGLFKGLNLEFTAPSFFSSKASKNLEHLLKIILAHSRVPSFISSNGSTEDNKMDTEANGFIKLLKGMEGLLALESRLKIDSAINPLILLPIFFEGDGGQGLLAIYRRAADDREDGTHTSEGRTEEMASIEMELFMSNLGPLRIFAHLRRDGLNIFIRVRRDAEERLRVGLEDLKERLLAIGIEIKRLELLRATEPGQSSPSLFDQLEDDVGIHVVA